MKEYLKNNVLPILSKHPKFWNLFWKYRHCIEKDGFAIATDIPHISKITKIVDRYKYDTLLEIGCGSGSNLIKLAKSNPNKLYHGIDINNKAIEDGNLQLDILGIKNVKLSCKNLLDSMVIFQNYDILLSSATLIYFNKQQIIPIIDKMLMNRIVVLSELHTDKKTFQNDGCWVHNYKKLLPNCQIIRYEKGDWQSNRWMSYGNIIIYEKCLNNR